MKRIIVVDDEKNIRDLIKKYLEKENYQITLLDSGELLKQEMERLKPDLLVLDIMLPGVDGLELCREIRKKSEVPIIFVSARDEELDKIIGLELGADDYLTKPFSPRELVVRIKNIFKRLEKSEKVQKEQIRIKDLCLSPEKRYVEKEGQEIKLTLKEYDLFEFLVRNKNMPFTREQLLERIWGYHYGGDTRLIDDLVKRLRKKLAEAETEVEVTTVWGYGYKIDG